MCLGQREDSEVLQFIQLEGCVILIDQNGILPHDGMPLYAYQICDFDKIVMFYWWSQHAPCNGDNSNWTRNVVCLFYLY